MTHPIPDAAFDKHVALLGMTGAGKTSVIKTAIVEPDLEADRRVLIITPKDDWWGLRLSKTGKSAGFDIPIFGGRHEDYPLQVKDAALLAETYGSMKGSAIFCTSKLSTQDRARWFAAFAERLLTANRGWVRVVIDEAHVFMPKQGAKGGGAVSLALHAGNELVSQGRSGGLRIVLASQRSAKLHNDALTQCSCLIAMLLMAPHDRDAVKDWIADQADPERGKEIIASLATLNPGQAWVWAPGAKFLECVQFARPATFDSSAAPDDGADAEHRLKPINLDALKGKLAVVEAEAKANDPKALKAEIARLKAAASNEGEKISVSDPAAIEAAEKRGFDRGLAAAKSRVDFFVTLGRNVLSSLRMVADDARKAVERHEAAVMIAPPFPEFQSGSPSAYPPGARTPRARPETAPARNPSPAASGDGSLSGPQRQLLQALAWWAAMGHQNPTRVQVATIAGWRVTSGHLKNIAGSLRTLGLIEYPSEGAITLTVTGAAAAPAPDTSATLEDSVRAILTGPQRIVFDNLQGGETVTREDIAKRCGWEPTSGHVKNVLGSMRSLEVIDYPSQGMVARAEWIA